MPIILSRANNGSANVEIELVGTNTLIAGSVAGEGSIGLGNGAIVKQDGGGSLTFTGSGSLNAQATGVVIGSPYVLSSSERPPYDCSNITFAQTGTITATTTDGFSACVGAAAGYTTAISSTPGSNCYAIGGGAVKSGYKGVTVTGGTIVNTSGLTIKAYDVRSGVSGFAYGAYIATSDAVSSLSVKANGADYPYTTAGIEAQSGKVWLYLPTGNAAVTLNGTQYYGAVDSSVNTELKQAFNPVTGITGLPNYKPLTEITGIPSSIQNGVAVTLTPGFIPSDASYRSVVWSVKSGSATINGNIITPTAPGTLVLMATVANGTEYGTAYTQNFTVTVPYVPVTDITASIPATLTINEELPLSGSVTPGDASYKAIMWSVTEAGTTGAAITSGKLKATAAGTLTLRATVANGVREGTDFIREYTIQVLGADSVLDISVGSITITSKDTTTNTVTYAGYSVGSKEVPKTETIVINGSYSGTTTRISVDGTTAVMLLKDVSLSNTGIGTDGKNCINLENGASLTLSAAGSNTVSTNSSGDAAAIHVPEGTTLTIEDGGGSLTITSGNGAAIGGNCGRAETAKPAVPLSSTAERSPQAAARAQASAAVFPWAPGTPAARAALSP